MKRIMFNDRYGLTQAVLEGKKTMTRRIVPIDLYNQTDWKAVTEGDFEAMVDGDGYYHDIRDCGRYRVGEEVWIAQSYKNLGYKPNDYIENVEGGYQQAQELAGFTNKMFVRSLYLMHRIHITNIKVERLQDISDEDCLKEGVEKWIDCYIVSGIMESHGKNNVCFDTPREAFAALIDRISGRGTWQSNPWVYVYTFELVK